MSILLDTLRKYPDLFNKRDSMVIDGRMCDVLAKHIECNGCTLYMSNCDGCLADYRDNPDLPADIAELQQSNPELFI